MDTFDAGFDEAYREAIAAELRGAKARRRPKITVADIMRDSDLAKSTVLNYLNGKRDIPMPVFRKLCSLLDADPRAVFDAADKAVEDLTA